MKLRAISPMKTARLQSGSEGVFRTQLTLTTSDVGASKMAPQRKPRTSPARKVCAKCKADKPAGDFYPIKHNADGLRSWCKVCSLESKQAGANYGKDAASREALPLGHRRCTTCRGIKPLDDFGPDKKVASGKSCRCRPCLVSYQKDLYRKHRGKQTEAYRKYMYGITPEQFAAMRAVQNDCCAICTRPFPNATSTHVDHDHATEQVRGLLCNRCNHGLGMFVDDIELLVRAAEYLRKHNALKLESA